MENVIRKLTLFLVGYCVYITIEVLFRGFSYPLMGFVGGLIMLILDSLNNKISWDINILVYGIVGSAVITLFELVIGEILQYFQIASMWDYSNMPLNYDGVICLPFSILWFFISYVAVFLADAINYYGFEELPVPYYNFCGKVIIRFKEKKCKL